MTALEQILEHKIVAILRGVPPPKMLQVAEALYAGGIRVLEVTLNSEQALPLIEQLSHAFDGKMLIGAGTVLSTADVADTIAAGAKFLISPTLDAAVIKATKDAGLVSIPGALTPSEILTAHNLGGDIVKVFPCPGAAYIKDVLAPLNKLRLMPTGGVDAGNIKTFAAAGSAAYGIGSALVQNQAVMDEAYLADLTLKSQQLISALHG